MTDINFIDGQALEPYYFGNNDANGVWKPIKYTGMYGTNGFYLTFGNTTSTTTLGYDSSPNGNNWTTNNISLTAGTTYDAMLDVPTNTSATVANYAVMSPLDKGTSITLQDANLTQTIGATHNGIRGTFQIPTSGKWYWEVTIGSTTSNSVITAFGLATASSSLNTYAYNTTGTYCIYAQGSPALLYITNGSSGTSFGSAISAGTVCGIAYDADNGQLYLAIANTYYNSSGSGTGNPAGGTNSSMAVSASLGLFPYVQTYSNTNYINFGQRPFTYTPPSGFVALNTYNLPTPTILQGNKYMDATLYVGNGVSQNVVTATGFKPDFVWIKDRTTAGQDNGLYDTVRGTGRTLYSNLTNAESSVISTLTAFNSNGYTVGTENMANKANDNFVGWSWQAGQGSTSSNTQGSITSTVSVNTTAGFSIVTWTGNGVGSATVGHGLGVTPAMVISKGRSYTNDWWVGHKGAATGILQLNSTNAVNSSSGTNGSLGFQQNYTSTVFGFNNGSSTINNANQNGITYVAYCWAEIAGFSKFGSYTGNGNANGSFIYTGFQPKFVMIKRTDAIENWVIWTPLANGNGIASSNNFSLFPNLSNAQDTTQIIDVLSNGFKQRDSGTLANANGGTYIFAAFASNPFRNSNAF